MPSRSHILLIALVVAGAAAAPIAPIARVAHGRAADPLAEAKKKIGRKFDKAVNKALATFQDQLDARFTLLRHDIDEYADIVEAQGYDFITASVFLCTPLVEFNGDFSADIADFVASVGEALKDAYGDAEDLGIAGTDMPADFRFGAGGTIDGIGARVDARVDAVHRAIGKRLAKIAKHLRENENIEFVWRLGRPYRFAPPLAVGSSGYFDLGFLAAPLTIEVILAFSVRDVADDVGVIIAGRSSPPGASVGLLLFDQDLSAGSITPVLSAEGTFQHSFSGRSEGNICALVIPHLEDSGQVRADISIR